MQLSTARNALISRPFPKGGDNGHAAEIGNEILGCFRSSLESRKVLSSICLWTRIVLGFCRRVHVLYLGVQSWKTPPRTKLVEDQPKQLVEQNSAPISPVLLKPWIVVGLEAVAPGVGGILLPLKKAPCPRTVRFYLDVNIYVDGFPI